MDRVRDRTEGHGTDEELQFIEKLGRFCSPAIADRRFLLMRYRDAVAKRVNWGRISSIRVIQAVNDLLAGAKV